MISIDNVTKVYRLGAIGGATLQEDFARWWAKLRGEPDPTIRIGAKTRQRGEHFWALNGVSFTVNQGDVVGIIGRNGAGKSTLLKILSQVTGPTSGSITLRGRVASLLEVGTGFHPDLSGRENIFLNGAILGMSKREIRSKLDEIVTFSECEAFIDTPVKRYSSGMYVRLAFAVAAHLDPEILIVDEVLAVGDAQFQRKCLGKMGDVARAGRTILFVSHSMAAVSALCTRAVLLRDGRVAADGNVHDVTTIYQSEQSAVTRDAGLTAQKRRGSGKGRYRSIAIAARGDGGRELDYAVPGSDIVITSALSTDVGFSDAAFGVVIYDATGVRVIDAHSSIHNQFLSLPAGGTATITQTLRNVLLKPGVYRVDLWLGRGGIEDLDWVEQAGELRIGDDPGAKHSETFPGVYQPRFTHQVQTGGSEEPALLTDAAAPPPRKARM